MKTTYISRAKFGKFTAAIAAAALLAGTAAPGVLAADYTAQLTKTIDMTAAPGAGVPHGSITFTVGTVANLPSWAAGTAVKGTAAQYQIHRAHRRLYGRHGQHRHGPFHL